MIFGVLFLCFTIVNNNGIQFIVVQSKAVSVALKRKRTIFVTGLMLALKKVLHFESESWVLICTCLLKYISVKNACAPF